MLKTLIVLFGTMALAIGQDTPNPDLEALQGTWKVVEAEVGGEPVEDPSLEESTIVFEGTTVRVTGVQEEDFQAQVSLNSETSPRQIDVVMDVGEDQGETVRGIYKIENERATFCWAEPGQPRPESFSTEEGTGQRLIVVERAAHVEPGSGQPG